MFSLFSFSSNYVTDNADLIKTGAYKALLRSGIDSLPIYYKDVFESLKYSITQIYVYSYQRLSEATHLLLVCLNNLQTSPPIQHLRPFV